MMPYEKERVRKRKRMTAGAAIGITVCILAYGPAVFGHGGEKHERKALHVNGEITPVAEESLEHPAPKADCKAREENEIGFCRYLYGSESGDAP